MEKKQVEELGDKLQKAAKEQAEMRQELTKLSCRELDNETTFSKTLKEERQRTESLQVANQSLSAQSTSKDLELTKLRVQASNLSLIKQQLQVQLDLSHAEN